MAFLKSQHNEKRSDSSRESKQKVRIKFSHTKLRFRELYFTFSTYCYSKNRFFSGCTTILETPPVYLRGSSILSSSLLHRFFVPLFFLIACFTDTLLSYHFFFDSVSLLQLHFRFRFPIPFCICDIHISQFLSSSSLSSVLVSSSLSLSSSFHNFIDSLLRFGQRDGVAV